MTLLINRFQTIMPASNVITFDKGEITATYDVVLNPEVGGFHGLIPAFNISFSADSESGALETAQAMVGSFFRYWITINTEKAKFIAYLKVLGFKTKGGDLSLSSFPGF